MKIAIILNAPSLNATVKENDVIFVDGAYRFKEQLNNKNVLGVVGDFDTLGFIPETETVVRLNPEKDFTDGERAIKFALELNAESVTVYGAFGGRIEHVLGNIALLKFATDNGLNAEILDENVSVRLVRGIYTDTALIGKSVSILPFGDSCTVDNSFGLYYPLNNLTLYNGKTVGISNKTVSETFGFNVKKGLALVIKYL